MNTHNSKLLVIQMLAISGAIGCANTQPPRSIEMAQIEIDAAKKEDIASVYPGMVEDAERALEKSRAEAGEGKTERADLHAQIARAKVQSARSLVKRQEAQNQMKAMENSVNEIQGVAEDTENMSEVAKRFRKMQSDYDEATREFERFSGVERDARRSLAEARRAQSQAIAVGAPELSPRSYDEGEMLVESSLRQLTIGGPEESLELSTLATEAFSWAAKDARGVTAANKAEGAMSKRSALEKPARQTLEEPEREPEREPEPMAMQPKQTASAQLRQLAQEHVLKVKMERAEALGRGEDNLCPENFKEAGAVLDIASEELSAKRYANAFELAVRAEERLKRCDDRRSTTSAPAAKTQVSPRVQARAQTEPQAQKKPEPEAKVEAQASTKSKAEMEAIEAITEVQIEVSKMRLKRPNDLRVTEATSLLTHAEEWLDREQFQRSLSLANAAQTVLASPEPPPAEDRPKTQTTAIVVRPPDAQERPEPKPEPSPTPDANGTDDTDEMDAPADKLAAIEAIAQARRTRAGADLKSSPATVKVADSLLQDARSSFSNQRYPEASALAEQATASYSALKSPSTSSIKSGDSNWQEAYKTVLDALVARDRAIQVSSQESNQTLERGVEFLRKGRKAWGSADYETSKRFAEAALKDFTEVHSIAKQSKEAAVQAKVRKLEAREMQAREEQEREKESSRKAAADSLRELEIALTECASCAERAPEDFEKVGILVRDAKTEFTRGEFTESQRLSKEAQSLVKGLKDGSWEIVLGPNLRAKNGAIEVEPKVDFKTGSTSVTPESRAGIRALATLLRENPRALESLEIQGYTDSRGNDDKNLQLSQGRADDVLSLLKAEGVDPTNMRAVGYGESNPIASNDSEEGRASNRRVEFRIRTSQGVTLKN